MLCYKAFCIALVYTVFLLLPGSIWLPAVNIRDISVGAFFCLICASTLAVFCYLSIYRLCMFLYTAVKAEFSFNAVIPDIGVI